jgi:hypothetical protein
VKFSLTVLCGSKISAGLFASWAPCNDKADARKSPCKTSKAVPPAVYVDADYDAE